MPSVKHFQVKEYQIFRPGHTACNTACTLCHLYLNHAALDTGCSLAISHNDLVQCCTVSGAFDMDRCWVINRAHTELSPNVRNISFVKFASKIQSATATS